MGHLGLSYVIPVVIFASFSIAASLAVILTFIVFREMRNSPFMKIVTYVSIADFFGNIGYLRIDKPANNSTSCIIEATLNGALYPCSWLWTTTLSYFLYLLATEGKTPKDFQFYNMICWIMPIVLYVIQTPFSEYKSPNSYDFEVCAVGGYAGLIYHFITYYGMYFLSLFYMIYLQWRISELEKKQTEGIKNPAFLVAQSALRLYPTWMIICWLPHVITVFVLDFFPWGGFGWDIIYYIGDILKILHGAVAAFIFFSKSREARRLWYRLFFHKNLGGENSVEMRTPSEFNENDIYNPSIIFGVKADPMRGTIDMTTMSITDSDL